jgi:transposase-like protein
VTHIDVPKNWDTKEWLEEAIKLYSIRAIARAVGRDKVGIQKRLKKWKIKYDSDKHRTLRHPKCNREWIYKHYVTQGLSQIKCAKLAGVSKQTFNNWLNRFKIPVRIKTKAPGPLSYPWVKRLCHDLEQMEMVTGVYLQYDRVHVRFRHRTWENYFPGAREKKRARDFAISREQGKLDNIPTVTYQYEYDLVDGPSYPAHLEMNKQEYKRATVMERRIALHTMTNKICLRGWVPLDYPMCALEDELERTRQANLDARQHKGDYIRYVAQDPDSAMCGRIGEHFFDLSFLTGIVRSPRLTLRVLKLVVNGQYPATTHSYIHRILQNTLEYDFPFPRVCDPACYMAIFRRLGVRGPVLDLHPGLGEKAIACALMGIPYRTLPDEHLRGAVDKGFMDFIGCDYAEWDGRPAEWALCDNALQKPVKELGFEHLGKAKRVLMFVPEKKRQAIQGKMPPSGALTIRANRIVPRKDYLFLY